jgi:hypothetical protein
MPSRQIFAPVCLTLALITANCLAAPLNDPFASREVLSPGFGASTTGTTIDATIETGEPVYVRGLDSTASVWYEWTANAAGWAQATATAVSATDEPPSLNCFTGATLDSLVRHCDVVEGSSVRFPVTAGQKYFLHAVGKISAGLADFTLSISSASAPAAPANDNFASATSVTGAVPKVLNGTTRYATLEGREPRLPILSEPYPATEFLGSESSVWYRWTVPASGWYAIYVSAASFPISFVLYQGTSVDALTRVAVDESGLVRLNSTSGQIYYLQVLNEDATFGGAFTVNIQSIAAPVPPANNNFASRINLGSVATVLRTTDDNFDATNEAGEKLPENSGATVWFSWTAPDSAAYQIDTDGSTLDTVLAVYAGTTLAGLSLLAYNDEGFDGTVGPSKLVLKAVAGQTYQIQIGGWLGYEDEFYLRIGPGDEGEVEPAITSFSATPSPVNVTSGPQTITVTATVTGDPAPASLNVRLLAPSTAYTPSFAPFSDGIALSRFLGATDAAGGFFNLPDTDPEDGLAQYSGTITLPARLPAGSYQFVTRMPGLIADELPYGSPNGLSLPGGGKITVTNTSSADALPTLTSVSASPTTVDVTGGPATVTFTANASDSLGVDLVRVELYDGNGLPMVVGSADVPGVVFMSLTSGTATSGTYGGTLNLPRFLRPGKYYLSTTVGDAANGEPRFGRDYGWFNPYGLAAPGASTQFFTVTNTGPVDCLPPQVVSLEYEPSAVDTRGGPMPVRVRARIRDWQSGLRAADVRIFPANFSTFLTSDFFKPQVNRRISGDGNDGVYETVLIVQQDAQDGTWDHFLTLDDNLGNLQEPGFRQPFPPSGIGQLQVTSHSGQPLSAESEWIRIHFADWETNPDATMLADPDKDGLPNIIEFHLGTDPRDASNSAAAANLPTVTRDAINVYLEFGQSAANQALGAGAATELFGQKSTDLAAWVEPAITNLGGGRFRVPSLIFPGGKAYLRLAARLKGP